MGQKQSDLITGALLGGILGGVAGLLLAPKSGKELREDIMDGYDNLNEKTREYSDKGSKFLNCCSKKGSRFFGEMEEGHCSSTLLTGGAIGAVIGATAALLLAPNSGKELREGLGDKYEDIREQAEEFVSGLNDKREQIGDRLEDWQDTFKTIIDKFSSHKGRRGGSKIGEIADWANLGMKLIHQLQKRR
jgi:gas vesicle protein